MMEPPGQHWYRLASEAAPDPRTAAIAVVADRTCFVRRATWFAEPAP